MNSPPDDDIPEMPDEEMEMELEQARGCPLAGNPAERIRALTKRIAYLEERLQKATSDPSPMDQDIHQSLVDELIEGRRQLKEWQTQHDGRN